MPMQFETVARVGAGEARFEGADNVVSIDGALVDPSWNSAGSADAWRALFLPPTDGQPGGNLRGVTDVDLAFSGTGAFMTASGVEPTATDGFPETDESFKHMRDVICGDATRRARFFLPSGVTMFVRIWWGSI